MKRIFLFVNGIRTDPRNTQGWTDRAVQFVNERLPVECVGQSYEYHSRALFRRLGQGKWAEELAQIIGRHRIAGSRVHVIAHSNGCDLLARVLLQHKKSVESAHLIAAAADEDDFEQALLNQRISRLHLYGSRNDLALKVGARASRVLTFGCLGYGSMGLKSEELEQKWTKLDLPVTAYNVDDYGHSTWFQKGVYFDGLMARIAHYENVPVLSP